MSQKTPGDPQKPDATPRAIVFQHIKAPDYRTVLVDGAFGGVGPRGNLNMAFYTECVATPLQVVHEVKDDGTLGKETARESREGFVREMTVNAVMSLDTAETIANWMLERVRQGREMMGKMMARKE
jgi:hypothetical protein